jgi:hypothetical protein
VAATGYNILRIPEAKFMLNSKDGTVEIEGPTTFVDKHLQKLEQIFNSEIGETLLSRFGTILESDKECFNMPAFKDRSKRSIAPTGSSKHSVPRQSSSLPPIPVDLKGNGDKLGLRQFYSQKKPSNHYEKTAVFAYYLVHHNRQSEVRYGELLSCYEEVDEKKPSITDIIKNTIRYKGWLEPGSDKYTARLTISGENFVKFDLPQQRTKVIIQPGSSLSGSGV